MEVYGYRKSLPRVKIIKTTTYQSVVIGVKEEHDKDFVLFLIMQTYFQFIDTDTHRELK